MPRSHEELVGTHFLDQLEERAYYGVARKGWFDYKRREEPKTQLWLCVAIQSIHSIDTSEGCYTLRMRLYMMWQCDVGRFGRLHKEGHYYTLSQRDREEFLATHEVPTVRLDAVDHREEDPSVRVYGSGAVMYNVAIIATVRHTFALERFPFDAQALALDFSLDSARFWDKFDLHVHEVIFKTAALRIPEWHVYEPKLLRRSTKRTTVYIRVYRASYYYVAQVFSILTLLACSTLLVFVVPAIQLADRLSLTVTLLLTTIAFKFAIRDAIPKVAYSTFLDTYMFRCEFYFFFAATACAVDFFVRQSFIIACCCALTLVVSLGSWVIAVKRALRHQQLDDVDDLQASPHPVDDDGTRPHHHQPPHLLHPETRIPWYCFRFEFPWFLPPPKGRPAINGADGARAVCSPPIVPVPTKGDIVTIDAAIKKPQSLRD